MYNILPNVPLLPTFFIVSICFFLVAASAWVGSRFSYLNKLDKEREESNNRKLVIAFDLDHTLIDSTHRTRFVDGVFDLQYWKDMSKIMIWGDTIMPLISVYRGYQRAGFYIIAVTAREMNEEDFLYLEKYNLTFDEILHRGDSTELDHLLKDSKLGHMFDSKELIPFQAYDDKQDNLDVFDKWGFRTFHATYMNQALLAGSRDAIPMSPKECVENEPSFLYTERKA